MIRLTVRGIDVTVSSAAEAAALIRELTGAPAPTHQRHAEADNSGAKDGFDRIQTTLSFLNTIRNAAPQGADVDQIAKVLKVSHPKGIGGRAAIINSVLKELGFNETQVYDNQRTPQGRRWTAGPRLTDALDALRRQATR